MHNPHILDWMNMFDAYLNYVMYVLYFIFDYDYHIDIDHDEFTSLRV